MICFVVPIVGRSNSLDVSSVFVYEVRKVSTYPCSFDASGWDDRWLQ